MRCSAWLAIALAAAGCTKEVCSRSSDCTTGLVCTTAGNCEIPVDASTGDGGTGSDATAVDAALPDSNTTPIGDAATDAFDDDFDGGL